MIGAMSKTEKLLFGPKLLVGSARCVGRELLSKTGIVPKKSKVFAIGFNKTGTSSLHEIFVSLGYHSNHGEYWRKTDSTRFHFLFDAFCDGIPEDFTKLDSAFAGSKFILQVRDLDTWVSSRIEHIQRRPKNRNNRVTEDWSVENKSVMAWITKRNEYHLAVMEHFRDRPDDLLIVNFIRDPMAADKIGQFLNSEVHLQKPHANRNKKSGSVLKHAELISTCLISLGIPQEEWKSDLLCKSLLGDEQIRSTVVRDTSEIT